MSFSVCVCVYGEELCVCQRVFMREELCYFHHNETVNCSRERVLSFICSGDDLSKLSKSKQFSLLQKNLPEATVLIKVLGFNMKTWAEEMDFVFTNKDMQQFKVCMKILGFQSWLLLNVFISGTTLQN